MSKSTLVKFIVNALAQEGINPETDVANVAYSGKAATVLAKKGNPNCMTLHKLLYHSRMLPSGKYQYIKKKFDELEYKVVVVDECSMMPQSMISQLLSYPIYVIFCGDPFQLEAINKEEQSHLLDKPHVFLDEIMRQAQESSIIRLSMDIRNGKPLYPIKTNELMVLPKKDFINGMLLWSDITICATNKTRITLNQETRHLLGYEQPIEQNEKIMFLRNYWDNVAENGTSLTNGIVGYINDWNESNTFISPRYKVSNHKIPIIEGRFISEDGEDFGELQIDKQCLITGQSTLTDPDKYKLRGERTKHLIPMEATYGYCATCWKFQGSQAEKVLGIEESFPRGLEHQKYLYTMLTRSEEKCVIIMNR